MKNDIPKLVLLDSSAIIHRAYHGLPPLTTHDGVLVNAVYGFATTLFKVLEEFKPKYIAACFDVKGPTVRHHEFKEYKAHRPAPPDDLIKQFQYVREVCKVLNIPVISLQGYEADDVIGTIVEKISKNTSIGDHLTSIATSAGNRQSLNCARDKSADNRKTNDMTNNVRRTAKNDIKIIIVTGDMDALQLVNENVEVYSMSRGIKKAEIYNIDAVKEKYGFMPNQLVDYKALRGDPSDNIPGVPGIGEKTATTLIQNFQSIENLYEQISKNTSIGDHLTSIATSAGNRQSLNCARDKSADNRKTNDVTNDLPAGEAGDKRTANNSIKFPNQKTIDLLLKFKDQAFLSRKLATIIKDVPIDFKLSDALTHDYDKCEAEKLFRKLEFKSLIARLPHEHKNHSQSSLF